MQNSTDNGLSFHNLDMKQEDNMIIYQQQAGVPLGHEVYIKSEHDVFQYVQIDQDCIDSSYILDQLQQNETHPIIHNKQIIDESLCKEIEYLTNTTTTYDDLQQTEIINHMVGGEDLETNGSGNMDSFEEWKLYHQKIAGQDDILNPVLDESSNLMGNNTISSVTSTASTPVSKKDLDPNTKPYKCHKCSKRFRRAGNLEKHLNMHIGENPYRCNTCNMEFRYVTDFKQHMKIHMGDNKSIASTFRNNSIINHQENIVQTSTDPFSADPSAIPTTTQNGEKVFQCSRCNKKFPQFSHLKRHQRIHVDEENPFECSQCSKKFRQLNHLKLHQRQHTKQYLKEHGLIPADSTARKFPEIPESYLFSTTPKKPSTITNFQIKIEHVEQIKSELILDDDMTNSIDYEYQVEEEEEEDEDSIATTTMMMLDESIDSNTNTSVTTDGINLEKDLNERRHKCNTCGEMFKKSAQLRIHERIHTGEQPYQCNVCFKSFKQVGNLKRHERIHTGEKPYNCNVCNKDFRQVSNLKRHQRMHAGEKPYLCNITNCNKAFSQISNLRQHERSAHKNFFFEQPSPPPQQQPTLLTL